MNQIETSKAGELKLQEAYGLVSQAVVESYERGDEGMWALGDLVPLRGEITLLLPSGTVYPAPPEANGADPLRLLEQAIKVISRGSVREYPVGTGVVLGRLIDAARDLARYRGVPYPLTTDV